MIGGLIPVFIMQANVVYLRLRSEDMEDDNGDEMLEEEDNDDADEEEEDENDIEEEENMDEDQDEDDDDLGEAPDDEISDDEEVNNRSPDYEYIIAPSRLKTPYRTSDEATHLN